MDSREWDLPQLAYLSIHAAGNLLSDGTTTRSYDALNRLVAQAEEGRSMLRPYTYNGDGVLVNDGTTTYAQDLAAPLSQVLSDGTASYVYGHDRLRALGGPWYVGDALGSVRQILDDAGAVLATTNYDPWGTPQGTLSAPFGFTGELHHQGQVYLRARWYAPGQGAFVTKDPFRGWDQHPATLHPYRYVGNNPLIVTDPSGQCYPPLAWLRDVEPTNCQNLDMAIRIAQHPNASLHERVLANSYITAFVGSHAGLVVGAGILTWQAVAASTGVVTAVSQWGAAHVVAGTAVSNMLVGGTLAAEASTLASVGLQAGHGDPTAAAMLACPAAFGIPPWGIASLEALGTTTVTDDVAATVGAATAADDATTALGGAVRRYNASLRAALEQFADAAPAAQAARGYGSWGKTWTAFGDAATMSDDLTMFVHVNAQGEITGAMTIGVDSTGILKVGALEGLGGGAGMRLLQTAARESVARGFGGRFTLDAASKAIPFYERMGGKIIDLSNNTFYFDETVSRQLLGE